MSGRKSGQTGVENKIDQPQEETIEDEGDQDRSGGSQKREPLLSENAGGGKAEAGQDAEKDCQHGVVAVSFPADFD